MKKLKRIIVFSIFTFIGNIYAVGAQQCSEQATFDTKSGLLLIPCLKVDNSDYYEASLIQRTSSTFVLDTYQHIAATPIVNHYYNTISDAHADGLVQYFPLTTGEGSNITDFGSANYGAVYSHNGGSWRSTTVDSQYGKLLKLTRSGGYIAPIPDPTAITQEYTILVMIPGRDHDSEFSGRNNSELFYMNKQSIINCGGQTLMKVFFDDVTDIYTTTMYTVCSQPMELNVPKTVAESQDGVVFAFFSHDGSSYKYQLGNSNESILVQKVNASNINALRIGGSCVSGICYHDRNALIFSYAMWNRVLSKEEKDAIVAGRSELVYDLLQ